MSSVKDRSSKVGFSFASHSGSGKGLNSGEGGGNTGEGGLKSLVKDWGWGAGWGAGAGFTFSLFSQSVSKSRLSSVYARRVRASATAAFLPGQSVAGSDENKSGRSSIRPWSSVLNKCGGK